MTALVIIKLVTDALIIGSCAYLIDRMRPLSRGGKKKKPRASLTLAACVAGAALTLVSNEIVQRVNRHLDQPVVEIHTSKSAHTISFKVRVASGTVDEITIRYPVLGVIKHLQDMNSIGDAYTAVARATGYAGHNSDLNYLELLMRKIRPGADLAYTATYTPARKLTVGGEIYTVRIPLANKYRVTYTWEFGGQKIVSTEWRSTKDDSITTNNPMKILGVETFARELSSKEIQKLAHHGFPLPRPLE